MSNKPKIYGTCKAGCQWETVHRSEFEAIAALVPQYTQMDGLYWLEVGKEYKAVDEQPNNEFNVCLSVHLTIDGEDTSHKLFDVPKNPDPFSNTFTLKVLGLCEVDGKTSIVYEFCGVRYSEAVEDATEITGVYMDWVGELYLYNSDATIIAKSAYEIAVDNGFEGTEQEWLESFSRGANGKSAYEYAKEGGYNKSEEDFAEDINPDNINATANAFIVAELAKRGQLKPEFAQSEEWLNENGDESKLYVLPDGMIWASIYSEITVEPTNAIPKSTDTDRTTIYNGKGYQLGLRINSSGVITSDKAPAEMGVTGFIPAKVDDVIEATNYAANASYTSYIAVYNESNECTGKLQLHSNTFLITLDSATFGSNFNAFRISGNLTDNTIIINKNDGGTTSGYVWANTGHAFVPADYEERIVELEAEVETLNNKLKNTNTTNLSIIEIFAPSPQLPADGTVEGELNGTKENITPEQVYAYIDTLLNKYPRFITREILGKDASGTHDWCRYICSRRAYDAWREEKYPPMYAWVNGSTVIYSESVSPRIGDTLYTTSYIGTAKGTVTAVNNANQSRTVDGVVYTRDKSKDVEPTLVYTETAYSPYFSTHYAGYKNGVYDGNKTKISTISSTANGILTSANGVIYKRYPLGDRNSNFKEIPAIVIGGNEHGTGGDPAMPAILSARMIKDLCECKNMDNPLLNLLKNEYMMVFCPVVNPWGLHKDNQNYCNSKGVNLDRNFDTIGWIPQSQEKDGWNTGDYGGSESETQYFMNTLVASKCKLAMCNHSYGEGLDYNMPADNREAVSGGICSYMLGREKPKYTETLLKIAEVMSANYNLIFQKNSDTATPETSAKTRSYIEWIGADGIALEFNSRDGFITDPSNEAQGKQFTARVMEAGYTQLLQVLYMLIDKQE